MDNVIKSSCRDAEFFYLTDFLIYNIFAFRAEFDRIVQLLFILRGHEGGDTQRVE